MRNSKRLVQWAGLALLALALRGSARAVAPGYQTLDLVLTREAWTVACAELGIDEAQKTLALPLLEEYWKAVKAVDDATHEAVLDSGWREVIERDEELQELELKYRSPRMQGGDEIIRKKTEENAEFESSIRFDMDTARLEGLRQADHLLEMLKYNLQEKLELEDAQVVKLGRIMRRENYLRAASRLRHAMGDERSRVTEHDFGPSMDLFQLVELASEEGGEIAQLKQALIDAEEAKSDAEEVEASRIASLEEILEMYELRIDDMLLRRYFSNRKPPVHNPKIIVSADDPQYDDRLKQSAKGWAERYDTFTFGTELIRQLLASKVGEDAARGWQRRVNEYLCPQLTGGYWVGRLDEWIATQPSLTPEQIEQLKAIQAQYEIERQPIVQRAIRLGINARKREYMLFGVEPAQVNFAKACMDYRKLAARTIMQMKGVLTDEQFVEAMMCAYNHRPARIGPDIPRIMWDALNVTEEEYLRPLGPHNMEWAQRNWEAQQREQKEPQDRAATSETEN